MIEIQFKECCEDCTYILVDHSETKIQNCLGISKTYTKIGCAHQSICKEYIEQAAEEEE